MTPILNFPGGEAALYATFLPSLFLPHQLGQCLGPSKWPKILIQLLLDWLLVIFIFQGIYLAFFSMAIMIFNDWLEGHLGGSVG